MMKTTLLDARRQQMLELLAEGASARELAKKMGYSEGTVRVYLHKIYRTLGVKNRLEAVLWHLRHVQARPTARAPQPPAAANESFGVIASRDGMLAALGVMESFLGPYGRLWQVGQRLKGIEADAPTMQRRVEARALWRALLAGDFAFGKRLYDTDAAERSVHRSPEVVLLVLLLQIGGFTAAADGLEARLTRHHKGHDTISSREAELLKSLRAALFGNDAQGLASLHRLASASSSEAILKHLAMAALYYAYVARKDTDRAHGTADALWAEAETTRRQLEAMGVRPLARDASPPAPAKPDARVQAAAPRRKAAIAR